MQAAPAVTAAAFNAGAYSAAIDVLLQGLNGDEVYSNDRALYGYIEANLYLQLPHDFETNAGAMIQVGADQKPIPDINLAEFGGLNHIKGKLGGTPEGQAYRTRTAYLYYPSKLQMTKIALMNFAALVSGGTPMDDHTAFLAATLRARWCALGCYNVSKAGPQMPIMETVVHGGPNPGNLNAHQTILRNMALAADVLTLLGVDLPLTNRYMQQAIQADFGTKWVIKMAETIWCVEEFVVRVRGHHFKDDYIPLIKKFIEACFEGVDVLPPNVNMAHLFRTAIHPFGLHALPVCTAHFAIFGKVGNAALIRFSGAPNGMAVVTTTAAAIRAMQSEPWYGKFRTTYLAQITSLETFETHVLSNKFGFHMSAGVYGVQRVVSIQVDGANVTIERMKEIAGTMAAVGQGFIEAMREAVKSQVITSFSFEQARALEKYASSAPLVVARIRSLIIVALENISQTKDIKVAIENALPQMIQPAPVLAIANP